MTTQTLSPVRKNKSRLHSGNTLAYIVMTVFLIYFIDPTALVVYLQHQNKCRPVHYVRVMVR